jgi:hypothetical protein
MQRQRRRKKVKATARVARGGEWWSRGGKESGNGKRRRLPIRCERAKKREEKQGEERIGDEGPDAGTAMAKLISTVGVSEGER